MLHELAGFIRKTFYPQLDINTQKTTAPMGFSCSKLKECSNIDQEGENCALTKNMILFFFFTKMKNRAIWCFYMNENYRAAGRAMDSSSER